MGWTRIGEEIDAVCRDVYDISHSPLSTTEWDQLRRRVVGMGYSQQRLGTPDMMRILRKWGVTAAVATFGQANNAGSYISELRHTLRLRLGSDNVDAYISRGNAKGERGQFEEAIADYDQALQLQPDNAFAYDHRGFAKIALGQFEDAIADYDQALLFLPDFAASY